jgi:hypothetical protein
MDPRAGLTDQFIRDGFVRIDRAAQPHQGSRPRFLAQPPLLPHGTDLGRYDGPGSPVQRAISQALESQSSNAW